MRDWKNKLRFKISGKVILWIVIGILIIILFDLSLRNPANANQVANAALSGSGMVGGC